MKGRPPCRTHLLMLDTAQVAGACAGTHLI